MGRRNDMSNFFLCDLCKHKRGLWAANGELDCEEGHKKAKVMVDHGWRGRADPYDNPIDVCADYEWKGSAK